MAAESTTLKCLQTTPTALTGEGNKYEPRSVSHQASWAHRLSSSMTDVGRSQVTWLFASLVFLGCVLLIFTRRTASNVPWYICRGPGQKKGQSVNMGWRAWSVTASFYEYSPVLHISRMVFLDGCSQLFLELPWDFSVPPMNSCRLPILPAVASPHFGYAVWGWAWWLHSSRWPGPSGIIRKGATAQTWGRFFFMQQWLGWLSQASRFPCCFSDSSMGLIGVQQHWQDSLAVPAFFASVQLIRCVPFEGKHRCRWCNSYLDSCSVDFPLDACCKC